MPFANISARVESFRQGGEFPHGIDEGGDVEAEGGKIHDVHLPPHDEEPACGDNRRGEDAEKELHSGVEPAHGLVELPLGGFETHVGGLEFLHFRLLIGKGLGGADAGEA